MAKSYVHVVLTMNALVEIDTEAKTVRHLREPRYNADEFSVEVTKNQVTANPDGGADVGKLAIAALTDWWNTKVATQDLAMHAKTTRVDGENPAAEVVDVVDPNKKLPN